MLSLCQSSHDEKNVDDLILVSCNLQDQNPGVALVEVVGVVRGSERPSIFVPPNDPNSYQWFYVDVPAVARARGLPEDTIYIEDVNENVNPSNPHPLPKDVNTLIRSSVMPQDHLNYTLTWYGFVSSYDHITHQGLEKYCPTGSFSNICFLLVRYSLSAAVTLMALMKLKPKKSRR